MALFVRRVLPEWQEGDFAKPENQSKFKFVVCENFDDLTAHQEAVAGYDAFICTLGSRVGTGEENFRKVDQIYPTNFAKLAKQVGAPYYGLCTSQGANANSWFLYMRVKGQVENDLINLKLPQLDIYQPGLIEDRDNDFRIGEKIFSRVPFISKISSRDLGLSFLNQAILTLRKGDVRSQAPSFQRLNNASLVTLSQSKL